jgi:hypothetical protein
VPSISRTSSALLQAASSSVGDVAVGGLGGVTGFLISGNNVLPSME